MWGHLPKDLKGVCSWGRGASVPRDADDDDLVMIAGFYDLDRARGLRTIYIEHGAGQAYWSENGKPHPAYHGAEHPLLASLLTSPRTRRSPTHGIARRSLPGSPVCDPYPLITANSKTGRGDHVSIGTASCSPKPVPLSTHYVQDLGKLVRLLRSLGFEVIGHHHPRDGRLPTIWRNLQVRQVDVAEVRDRADILVVDNSSLAYEMLYLGRGVVTLNAPWYRREVEHGLRFWEHIPGWVCNNPEDLAVLDWDGLVNQSRFQSRAPAVAAYDRALSDGSDGLRAAAWVTALASRVVGFEYDTSSRSRTVRVPGHRTRRRQLRLRDRLGSR